MFKKILTIAIMVSLSTIFAATAYSEDLDGNDLHGDVGEWGEEYFEDGQPQVYTTADELVWSFDSNPGLAAVKYFEKTAQVCGVVSEINLKDGNITMLTDVGIKHFGVKCYIQKDGFANNQYLKVGDAVTVQGEIGYPLRKMIEIYNCFVIY